MNARDYIYNALHESMYVLKGDIEGLSSYLEMDFDDYFGSANSQIVENENGAEVLSEVPNEYVEDKVVCTAEEGREMFSDVRDEVLAEILQDILESKESLDNLTENEVEPDEDGVYYPKDESLTIIINDTPSDTFFLESWMDRIGTFMLDYCDMERYDVAQVLGCTHYFCDRGTKYNSGRWHETEYTTVYYKK